MLIEANHLALELDGISILKDVSLHMQKGEIYGLLGPNGAGKSTTIALLLGLYRADKGSLTHFSGQDAEFVSIRQRIGVMPEFAGFYEWMSAREYLIWYAGFYGGSQSPPDSLLKRVGLSQTANKPIVQFSRGMKQRLALARALVHGPELLILDEPTNGLDPRGRREIHDLLIDLANEDKVGILLCTHLLDDVERLCTRIGIIDNGKTVLEDDLEHLLRDAGKPRYRIHMTNIPEGHLLPPLVRLLEWDGSWWSFEIDLPHGRDIGKVWEDLLVHGWSFDEIQVESNSLEARYLELTGSDKPDQQEKAA
ncbi:ABC transporter ATP-binding protein [Marinobacter koreensis]|jgi:ABC-2 type transport system ATP-binding protein|uniref:ABC transporter ATP-binding protein n=1 Tax=Marinobacter koreensis TaxID=335974 RepID=A0ABW0RMX2_9GAMM|nr:ABC transporter ATP-binding protein [Marinobacter koreensis]MCK7549663.1 ABC transporter ATP-binding protein [Marinobacter koreensis]